MLNSIKNWFWRSETIFWARLQVAFGIVWGVLAVTDLSPLLSGKWLTIWLIINGVVTEYLRRRNANPTTVIVPASDGTEVQKSMLLTKPPGP